MQYRKLDSDGDYVFGGNAQDFLTGVAAVAQSIMTNLKLFQNEWWEDVSKGLPLFQNILSQLGNDENIKSVDLIIQSNIQETIGVKSIDSFSSTYKYRTYNFSCTVNTIYGIVTLSNVIF